MMRKIGTAAMLAGVLATAAAAAQTLPLVGPEARVVVEAGEWRALDQSCPTLPVDAGLRQRLVDVAAGEWQRFGFQVIDHRARPDRRLRLIVEPQGGDLVDERHNPMGSDVTRRALRLGLMEDEQKVRRAIGGYWSAVPNWDGYSEQSRIFRAFGDAGWARPWSAAFISYVICMGGLSDLQQFQRADGHRTYVDQAIAAADGLAPGAVFRARDVAAGLPKPGDLLCADRAETAAFYRSIADRRPDMGGGRAMHCDLVVAVKPSSGYVAVIGGNVVNSVSLTLVGIKKEGDRQRVFTAAEGAGARPWFAVLELQAPGTASLNDSVAIRALGARTQR